MRRIVFLLAMSVMGNAAWAQSDPDALELVRTPAIREYWFQVQDLLKGAKFFSMAATALECEIPHDRSLFLMPQYRDAFRKVAQNHDTVTGEKDSAVRRWNNRVQLYAFSRLTAEEKASWRAFFADEAFVKHLSISSALDGAPYMDPITGRIDAAGAIWLKSYLRREGELPWLRKTIAATHPGALADFDRVQELEQHGEADDRWLTRLTGTLIEVDLAKAYAAQIPSSMQAKIETFYKHPFFDWWAKATRADDPLAGTKDAKPPIPVPETQKIREDLHRLYPAPPGLIDKMLRVGPMDYAGKHVERFCPPKKSGKTPG